MRKKIKCSKKELLEYIKKRGACTAENWEIAQNYHLSMDWVRHKLARLKKEGLVISFGRGHWVLTEEGYERLKFYDKKDNTNTNSVVSKK